MTDEIAALGTRIGLLQNRAALSDADVSLMLAELESAHEELKVADDELQAQRREMEDLLRRQRSARSAQDRFLAVLPAAVVVTDSSGVIHTANAAAAALLRVRVDRLLRKPLLALIDPADRAEVRRALAELVAKDKPGFRLVVSITPRTGEPLRVELTATTTTGQEGSGDRAQVTWVLLASSTAHGTVTSTGLADVLVELTRLPLNTTDGAQILRTVSRLAQQAFSTPVSVSITRGAPSSPDLLSAESLFAQQLDGVQVMTGEGPCQTAWETRDTVVVADLTEDLRWPDYRAGALELGLRSVVAIPLKIGDVVLGALNFYSKDLGLGDPDTIWAAELLGSAVAAVVHETDLKLELENLSEHFKTALESRATIDQAKGIVMARQRCTPDEAFELLVKISSRTNVKLREVARRVVAEAAHH